MGFLKDLGGKLQDVTETAADKAKDLAEITKLNSAISAEEKQIKEYYIEIGKLVFEEFKDKPDSPVAEYCNKILVCQQNIEELKQKIAEIKQG